MDHIQWDDGSYPMRWYKLQETTVQKSVTLQAEHTPSTVLLNSWQHTVSSPQRVYMGRQRRTWHQNAVCMATTNLQAGTPSSSIHCWYCQWGKKQVNYFTKSLWSNYFTKSLLDSLCAICSNRNVVYKHFKLLLDKYCDCKWSESELSVDDRIWKNMSAINS